MEISNSNSMAMSAFQSTDSVKKLQTAETSQSQNTNSTVSISQEARELLQAEQQTNNEVVQLQHSDAQGGKPK